MRWDTARHSYVCPDGAVVQVPRRSLVQREREDEDSAPSQDEHKQGEERDAHEHGERETSRSQVLYRVHDGRMSLQLFVSGTEFDPSMSRVVRETDGARTLALPNSAREVLDGAFGENRRLRSVILNEGLETLGGCEDEDGQYHSGVFRNSQLRQIALPSTLRVLGDGTFNRCRELNRVAIREDSALKRIGAHSFSESGVEKITIPRTTKAVSANAFEKCENLKVV